MTSHASIISTERPLLAGTKYFIERSYPTIKLNLGIHNPTDLTKTQIVQYKTVDDNEQDVTQSDEPLLLPPTTTIAIITTEKNPYGLGFDWNLTLQQRLQFESDMFRSGTSKYSSVFI